MTSSVADRLPGEMPKVGAEHESQPLLLSNSSSTTMTGPPRNTSLSPTMARTTTALGRLTVLTWVSMILFGGFAAFQYVLPVVIHGNWTRWDKTDVGLYRRDQPLANAIVLLHLIAGVFFMIVGPVQFIPSIRRQYRQLHRWIGRVYVWSAVLVGGLMTFWVLRYRTSRRWIHEDVGNFLFAVGAVTAAVQSYRHARAHRWARHELWSWRLFAVIFGAAAYRIFSWPLYLVWSLQHQQQQQQQRTPETNSTHENADSVPSPSTPPPPSVAINLSFYALYLPSWVIIEFIWLQQQKETPKATVPVLPSTTTSSSSTMALARKYSETLLHICSIVLVLCLLPIALFSWIPSMLNLPTPQTRVIGESND